MNDEKLRELFTSAEPVDEPPLAPGYLAATTAAADRAVRHRRLRRTAVGGVAVVALAATGLVVQPQLSGTTTPRLTGAAAGGGRYDPLVSRLAPKWIPSGATSWDVSTTEDRMQSMRYMRSVPDPKRPTDTIKIVWTVELTLFAPGQQPVPGHTWQDGPLEGLKFGSGTKVDPVQGLPAEVLADPNGYTLGWVYPSGAHAVVTIPWAVQSAGADKKEVVERPAFGDRTPAVARRVAESLRVDGHTPLKFPFSLRLPAGQHVIGASTTNTTDGSQVGRGAMLTFTSDARQKNWSTVDVNSDIAPGKHVTVRHGFMLTVKTARGVDKDALMRGLRIFGWPGDPGAWRADPVLP